MDLNQMTSQNNGLPDTSNLLPSLMTTLAPILLLSSLLSIVLVIAYIFSMIRRYKVEKATLAMQKDIHEINERERRREAASLPQPPLPPNETIIVANSPTNTE